MLDYPREIILGLGELFLPLLTPNILNCKKDYLFMEKRFFIICLDCFDLSILDVLNWNNWLSDLLYC